MFISIVKFVIAFGAILVFLFAKDRSKTHLWVSIAYFPGIFEALGLFFGLHDMLGWGVGMLFAFTLGIPVIQKLNPQGGRVKYLVLLAMIQAILIGLRASI